MNSTLFSIFGNCKNSRRPKVPFPTNAVRPEFRFRFAEDRTFSRESTPKPFLISDFRSLAFDATFESLAQQAGRPLSQLEADLAWVATAVYLADRSAPRYPYGTNGLSFWRRRIHLILPVGEGEIWEKASPALRETLEYLTEDDWTFEFVSGRRPFMEESQQSFRELSPPPIAWTALFSGGLDSLAGAVDWLQSQEGIGLLVSGQTHNRIAFGQRSQVSELRQHFPQQLEHVGISYGFPDKSGLNGFESSQRTRAFIHTALGSLAALMAGNEKLHLFENGFGALNLPCDSTQFGSQNSRGTHPVFLQRMAGLVSHLFGRPFTIVNPFNFMTKGEMLSNPTVQIYGEILRKSFSCDRYPNYPHKASQCGSCSSCLIRRLSFKVGNIADDPASYSRDLLKSQSPLRESELIAVTKLTIQAKTMADALRLQEPWSALCAIWPDLFRAEIELENSSFKSSTIRLLRKHSAEWHEFYPEFQFPGNTLAA